MKKKVFSYYIGKRKCPVKYPKPFFQTIYKKNKNDAVYFYSFQEMLENYLGVTNG